MTHKPTDELPELFAHPFSSYCWKVLIALYERAVPFIYRQIDPDHAENAKRWQALWPVGQFPVLLDRGRTVVESSVIIEYLDLHHGTASRLVPSDPEAAIEARMLDGIVDDYVHTPMQRIVADFIRTPENRDPLTVEQAKATLAKSYDWLEQWLADREWAVRGAFGIADCAAAPALFYADWVHPIGTDRPRLAAYRARLLARPAVKRVVDDARPYRHFFPPGAPDRD
jgi:glutathione S-transferase